MFCIGMLLLYRRRGQVPRQRADHDPALFIVVQEVDPQQVLRIVPHLQVAIQLAVPQLPLRVAIIRYRVLIPRELDRALAHGRDLKGPPILARAVEQHFLLADDLIAAVPVIRREEVQRVADQSDVHRLRGLVRQQRDRLRVQEQPLAELRLDPRGDALVTARPAQLPPQEGVFLLLRRDGFAQLVQRPRVPLAQLVLLAFDARLIRTLARELLRKRGVLLVLFRQRRFPLRLQPRDLLFPLAAQLLRAAQRLVRALQQPFPRGYSCISVSNCVKVSACLVLDGLSGRTRPPPPNASGSSTKMSPGSPSSPKSWQKRRNAPSSST